MECEYCETHANNTNCPYLAIKNDLLAAVYETPEVNVRPNRFYIEGYLLEAYAEDLLLFDIDVMTYELTNYFSYAVKKYTIQQVVTRINDMVRNAVHAVSYAPLPCLHAHGIEVWIPTQ